MAKKTNCVINGKSYYRIYRKVGMKLNKDGIWVDDRRAFYGSCKSEAEQKYKDYLDLRAKGISEDKRCLGEMIDQWKEEVFKKSSDFANSTKVKYLAAYESIIQSSRLMGLPPSQTTAMDMQILFNSSDACYTTLRAAYNFLKHFYRYAELNGWCRNITASIEIPKKRKRAAAGQDIEVWEDEEIQAVADEFIGTTMRLLILLAVNTGLRFGEILALSYDDIQGNMLYVTKQLSEIAPIEDDAFHSLHITETKTTGSNRVVPLSKALLEEIEEHKRIQLAEMEENGYETNYLFTTSNGTFYYQRNIRRAIERACDRIGVDYHKFHAFRHTFGTNLSRAGIQLEETSKLMGHADVTTTAKYYVDVNAQRKLEAVEKIAGYTLGNK
jgi:integrase